MTNNQQRKKRLKRLSEDNNLPFDIYFLREISFEFGLDWDDQLLIEYPESIQMDILIELIKMFEDGIRIRLKFEGEKAKRIFWGGPLNGQSYFNFVGPGCPICRHIKRGEWLVYMVKDYEDPRAWYIGKASSKKKTKLLIQK